MPKKRHQTRYSKPQSTAPASLSSSSTAHNVNRHGDHERPSVNQLLASLRRTRLNGDNSQPSVADIAAPSVPPQIRAILRLPETPAPPPRRRPFFRSRFDAQGRPLPAGPPPPRSWLSRSQPAPRLDLSDSSVEDFERRLIPGLWLPGYGSLVDMVLRKIALDWDFQRSYNVHYLSSLPDHLRMALISYLTTVSVPGLSLSDLKIILLPQAHEDSKGDGSQEDPSSFNEGIDHLDLSTSVGRSLKLRELSQLLFSSEASRVDLPPESWDADEALSVPRPLLPNLTHLSLAVHPEDSALCSWRQLLSLATHLPTLTHLSLAFWPVPSMAPNLVSAKVVDSNGLTYQAGGSNPYSHTLDDEWSEQILILRKLSQSLYGLEYLDLTGCNLWFKALTASADGDQVDWIGDWGKMTHLILTTGYAPPLGLDVSKTEKFNGVVDMAASVERTVRSRRAGRGKIFTVERDVKVEPIPFRSPLAGF
ncbi:hypothetical protein N0V93_007407 [Gnomoniopsis smithogilvyi]|uniref:Tafazzin n=1 Tax=Gnomoniopsis smithogilvyi TaxID=1191159 RepID=A0A9W8YRS3_9PEZI|nr:hypothetical protein N0V93_007407 [Gnomoniopsis smithogilvyi]